MFCEVKQQIFEVKMEKLARLISSDKEKMRVKALYADERRRSPYSLLSRAWERPPATPPSPSLILPASIGPLHQTKPNPPNQTKSTKPNQSLNLISTNCYSPQPSPSSSTDTLGLSFYPNWKGTKNPLQKYTPPPDSRRKIIKIRKDQ